MNGVYLAVLLACSPTDSETDDYAACPVVLTVQTGFETIERCATVGADTVLERLMEYPDALHARARQHFSAGHYQMVVDCRSAPASEPRYARRRVL